MTRDRPDAHAMVNSVSTVLEVFLALGKRNGTRLINGGRCFSHLSERQKSGSGDTLIADHKERYFLFYSQRLVPQQGKNLIRGIQTKIICLNYEMNLSDYNTFKGEGKKARDGFVVCRNRDPTAVL